MVKYLAIDPGHSTGYCVIETDHNKCVILEYGFYDINRSSKYEGDWYIDFEKWIINKIDTHKPDKIIREGYFFSYNFRQGSNINVAYRTVIDMIARRREMEYIVVQPSEWKIAVCGHSRPTKIQIKQYGKVNSKKYMVQEALYLKYKIRFPNYSISQKNGKKIKFRHDTVDAVAMGVYYGVKKVGCNELIMGCECPDDIEWKKGVKVFNYDKIGAYNKCDHVFKSGKRKGSRCDRVCFDGNKCTTHRKKVTVEL